ncbi:sensor histidine kinase [Mucilaginibacter sp.]|jgi:signal transduction histidine kinase|uniref:sensor histidine kinase n=1 Tax=Mucilaginibacter sp. TaxID=1882438 RepID=UPI002C887235|nr:ATP-binding protein [Mucilaginibacter sp.]HTI57610.1 ATP-binding protein [Mucilaginibacter sp.]
MLALLFASLLLTAIVIQKTYTPKNNLYQTAQTLESNLQKKERVVADVINDKKAFDNLKTLQDDDRAALKAIKKFTTDEGIWVLTYKKGRLVFWSGIKVIPLHPIREGYSFVKESNGHYNAIKKTDGDFSAVFMIPVKFEYKIQNQYLQNIFAKNLLKDNNIEIAKYDDKNIYEIHSITDKYLFSVKVNPYEVNHKFLYFEIASWALCLLILCLLIHNICNYFAVKGYVLLSFAVLLIFIVSLRYLNIYCNWPDLSYKLSIFQPTLYYGGPLYPSFGDFCINVLAVSWFFCFVYRYRNRLVKPAYSKIAGYVIVVVCVLAITGVSFLLLRRFHGLVLYSKINFDVNNVLGLTHHSVMGIVILCFAYLIFYVLVEICLAFSARVAVPVWQQAAIFLAAVLAATFIPVLNRGELTLFYIFGAAWVFIRGYAYLYKEARLNSGALVSIILVCAFVSAIKLNHLLSLKEKEKRKELLHQLITTADLPTEHYLKIVERKIGTDPDIKRYFMDTVHNNDFIKTYLQKTYFYEYLSKFKLNVYGYDTGDRQFLPQEGYEQQSYDLNVFKDMVRIGGAPKISDYFYRNSKAYGSREYVARIPVYDDKELIGTLVISLDSKDTQNENAPLDLLVDNNVKPADDFEDYSYAYYSDNRLMSQKGKYDYSLINREFKGKVKDTVFKSTTVSDLASYKLWNTYNHLIYEPDGRSMLVISKKENITINTITSVTFFFIVFLAFAAIVIVMRWLWARIRILYSEENYFHWVLKINFEHILYKTRIQLSIVFAVVATLILVGVITYVSITKQYSEQQDATISHRLLQIGKAFENAHLTGGVYYMGQDYLAKFDEFANVYSADITLFNTNGEMLVSTQPKLYDNGLIAKRINGKAYINLHQLNKSIFINPEIIGDFSYKAGYIALTNGQNRTIGYLQLPSFSNEEDYKSRLSSLLDAMINIYALIFIAIGLLAVFIARQITTPLNIIQYSLSKTIYGQKNEPIKWKRKDEIGTLIAEYNNMIAALEQSAQKLAQSERESAWREMAKQVAHEIKNPLTPLKLGLQLLEKSWKDKDPKFDQKFERFSKSFVEQIESLSSIASEFSAFAKMPDTRLEKMDVFDILTQAVVVYKQTENIKINYRAPENPFKVSADRDQLLRCFNNLLKNAIEAIPQGRDGVIAIEHMITNGAVLLSIKDNGNGIPANLREKIFEPNFTTKSSGTGLGLAFVKNSIENAGGKVWFETIIGEGTTFYISLPEVA